MSALVVARTTLLRATRRPSTWVICSLAFLPAMVGAASGLTGHGVLDAGGPVALGLVAPLLVPALVAAPTGEQFESRTVVYWFTRPFPRAMVLVGDALGYAALAAGALAMSGMLLASLDAILGTAELASLARIPLAMAAEALGLVSLSVAAGALVPRHPVVSVLALLVLTEAVLPRVWDAARWLSLGFHASVLAGMPFAEAGAVALAAPPSALASLVVMALWAAAPLAAAMVTVSQRDVV